MRLSLPLISLICLATIANAQPTITRSGMEKIFGVGAVSMSQSAEDDSLEIGSPGGNPQTWDFSSLRYHTDRVDTFYNVAPIATPAGEFFPNATAANFTPSRSDSYTYFALSDSGLATVGFASNYDTVRTRPGYQYLKLPATIGTSWVTHFVDWDVRNAPRDSAEFVGTVDAYGTMLVPRGAVPCVRVRYVGLEWQGADSGRVRAYYFFWSNEGEVVAVPLENPGDTSKSKILLRDAAFIFLPTPSTVQSRVSQAHEITLEHYPNPFRGNSLIRAHVNSSTPPRLELFDLLGEMVRTIPLAHNGASDYSAPLECAALPPGTYLLRLTAGATVRQRSVVVTH